MKKKSSNKTHGKVRMYVEGGKQSINVDDDRTKREDESCSENVSIIKLRYVLLFFKHTQNLSLECAWQQ